PRAGRIHAHARRRRAAVAGARRHGTGVARPPAQVRATSLRGRAGRARDRHPGGGTDRAVNRAVVLPLLVVAVLFGIVGPSAPLALAFAVLTLVPLVVHRRVKASPAAQIVIAIALFGGAI